MDIMLADWMFALAASREAMTDGRLVRPGQAVRCHHKACWLPTPRRGITPSTMFLAQAGVTHLFR
jgi:hypothetical protein